MTIFYVGSGVTSSGVTLGSGDEMTVPSGGTAIDTMPSASEAPATFGVGLQTTTSGGSPFTTGGDTVVPNGGVETLLSFDWNNGYGPDSTLSTDAGGDIFGTTSAGGAGGDGTVFEVAKTAGGYASTPISLVSFSRQPGEIWSFRTVITDAAGNLFGTAYRFGADDGTVFELAKTTDGYATTPTTLASFNGADGAYPYGPLIIDAAGNLFGLAQGSEAGAYQIVFEVAKTAAGYASTPITLTSFNGADGSGANGPLVIDAAGDLFGTTGTGGADGDGTVFEVAKTAAGYASTPITLTSFNGADGSGPNGPLVIDPAGDLFGTTNSLGADGDGTVFEIAKTAAGYASTPATLVSFNGADGSRPYGGLIIDAAGNLFDTTSTGGAFGYGTVFEIPKTTAGYASMPTTLVSFNGDNSGSGGLVADAAGNLFGTTWQGGANGDGSVFEVTGSGFVTAPTSPPDPLTLAQISNAMYSLSPSGAPVNVDGYAELPNLVSANFLGFFGAAFQKGNQVVVAFRGTDAPGLSDLENLILSAVSPINLVASLGSVAKIITFLENLIGDASWANDTPDGLLATYVSMAAQFLYKVAQTVGSANITLTGHSLGGAIAQMLGDASGYTTVAFDAPGSKEFESALSQQLKPATWIPSAAKGDNTNYRLQGDPASLQAGTANGATITIMTNNEPKNPLDALNDHLPGPLISNLQPGFQTFQGIPPQDSPLPTLIAAKAVLGVATSLAELEFSIDQAFFAYPIDPPSALNYEMTETAGSPKFAVVSFPNDPSVSFYKISVESSGVWGPEQTISDGGSFTQSSGFDAFQFRAYDANGQAVSMEAPVSLGLSFTSTGTFSGQLISSPGAPGGQFAWAGATGDFATGTDWSSSGNSGAPGTADEADVSNGSGTITGNGSVSLLVFDNGGSWGISGSLAASGDVVFGRSTQPQPTTDLTSGSTIASGAAVDLGAAVGGSALVTLNGGTLSAAQNTVVGDLGSGTILVGSGGALLTNGILLVAASDNTAGTIEVSANGQVRSLAPSAAESASIVLAGGASSSASMTVSGSGALVDSDGSPIAIGNVGTGAVTVSQGGSVSAGAQAVTDAAIYLGTFANAIGSLDITDATTGVNAVGQLDVGDAGAGHLRIENGATVNTGNSTIDPTFGVEIAQASGGSGDATVTGAASLLKNSGRFVVGDSGLGTLLIEGGGTVITTPGTSAGLNGAVISAQTGSDGSGATVTGAGSNWQVSGTLDVGDAALGSLEVAANGTVSAGSLEAGVQNSGTAQLNLSGPGSRVSFSGDASIAQAGTATLSIGSGSTFSASDLTIGARGVGTVNVSDTGSLLDANGTLSLGASQAGVAASGLGLLNVTGGGSVSATAMNLANGATVVLDDTSLLTISDSGQPPGTVAGAVNNAGTIAMDVAGAAAELDAPLLNTGTVLVNQGTLALDAGGSSPSTQLTSAPAGTLRFGTTPSSASAPSFSITAGPYAESNTVVDGSTLDLSVAASATFDDSLLLATGAVQLGSIAASAYGTLTQAGGTLAGTGTLASSGPVSLTGGVQTGSGTTRLTAATGLAGAVQLDGGRTLENDGFLQWGAGGIQLGAGDASTTNHTASLTNAGVLDITTAGRIGVPGSGTLTNTGVLVADTGTGQADIDATVHSTGIIQLRSGTFGLNGGGDACSVSVAAGATLQFGPQAGGSTGGAFTLHSAVQNAGTVAVTAGTLTLEQGAAGAGAFVLDGSATADFVQGPGGGSSLTFLHQGSTLEVQQAAPFGATLSGFGGTDVLDVTPVSFAAAVATFAGGTLTVADGTHSAAFQLAGTYAQPGFHLVNDGHGGTAIGYG